MAFEDLAEFYSADLPLPIGGKTYRVPSPPADVGLHCQLIASITQREQQGLEVSEADLASLRLDDDEEQVFTRRILGSALDEMVADGVEWARVKHAAKTAYIWIVAGDKAAEKVWASVGDARAEARPPVKDHLPAKK